MNLSTRLLRLSTFIFLVLLCFVTSTASAQRLTSRWSDFQSPYQLIASEPAKEVYYSKTGERETVPASFTKALVVVTMRPGCPVGERVIPRLNQLQREYASLGIHFVILYPNASDRIDDVYTHAVRQNIVAPVYLDDQSKVDLTRIIEKLQKAADSEYVETWQQFKNKIRQALGNSFVADSTANYFYDQGVALLDEGKPAEVRMSLSRGLGLTRTPEVAVVDTRDLVGLTKSEIIKTFDPFDDNRILYRGLVDSWANPSIGHASNPANEEFLREKIHEIITNSDPATDIPFTSTQPEGCYISDQPRPLKHRIEGKITFYDHILPIVENKCQVCHRPGELAGDYFDFTDHDQLISVAETALEHIEARNMPPWNANLPKAGKKLLGGFVGDVRLTRQEIDTWRAWIMQQSPDTGVAVGQWRESKTTHNWPDEDEWQICETDDTRQICVNGQPDFVRSMPEPYEIEPLPATPSPEEAGFDGYRYYYFPLDFDQDRYVSAIEIKPGNKSVVHHIAALMADCPKENLQGTEALSYFYGLGGGLSGSVSEKDKTIFKVADWVPGDDFNARVYPKDQGIYLRKGTCMIFELHYTPRTSLQTDQSSIGMSFHKKEIDGETVYTKPPKIVDSQIEMLKDFTIGSYQMHKRVERFYRIPYIADILAFAPHMHYRGKDTKLYLLEEDDCRDFSNREIPLDGNLPDNRNKSYLNEDNLIFETGNYDFDWQRTYEFLKPLRIRPDQCLVSIGHFENSHFNLRNPNPAKEVRFGVKSTDEMFNFRVKYTRVTAGEK